ncbi:hypothetical protein C6568_03815 [Melaminivora suipulveris]|uniref:Toprim domain-containing protein n=1 Tax=Melaminivora suipulveris TaxID=2109913 RepID=A0A2R3Q9Y3_9BURK|nr:toprim domain-containing protein [Melaminivora suipulveris]AVO48484.1 hypothetical protein C6568_03815 [Melaminivora suipulveris]
MTAQEKAAGVVQTPEAADQKASRVIIASRGARVEPFEPPAFPAAGSLEAATQALLRAIVARGLEPAKLLDLIADGRLHRYRIQGDKAGSKNGWYVLHEHPVPAGAFGSWKTGETHTWRQEWVKPPTPREREQLRRQLQAAQAARDAEREAVQAQAREKATRLWERAKPATNGHPYLERKRVPAIGLRLLRDMLLVAARDAAGTLHTLQFIGPDGAKRFLTGGRMAGCYFAMGRPDGALLLCEGYATGATLHQATGHAVAVAFNCGNLPTVARALRAKFPALRIAVCADDDARTPGNPGLTRAQEAARAVGGVVIAPRFTGGAHGHI